MFYITSRDQGEGTYGYALKNLQDLFGKKFILMPNPTDGHWVRAIFGESEPAPTKKNRETWKKAAEKQQSQVIREHMGK